MQLRRVAPVLLAATLAGCGSFGAVGLGPMEQPRRVENDTLPPVASAPVEKSALPAPPPADTAAGTLTDPNATLPGTEPPVASTMTTPEPQTPAASGGELGRTDLLGGWTLTSGSESCQLFMTLTSWTGGYRASTRGCHSPELKSVSAWSLSGGDVVLAGAGGSPVAHLSSSGSNRFNGQTTSSAPISFYR